MTASATSTQDTVGRKRARRLVVFLLLPLLLASLAVVVTLWPDRGGIVQDSLRQTRASGTITAVSPCPMAPTDCDIAVVAIDDGPGRGTQVQALVSTSNGIRVGLGDPVMLVHRPQRPTVHERYEVEDRNRTLPLALLCGVFALAVLALSRWRGIASLAGLAVCLLGLTEFVVPAVISGANPLLVAVAGGTLIMVIALYLAHGLNTLTTVAIAGTVSSLALTGIVGHLSLNLAGITGLNSDNVGYLTGYLHDVDLQGLLLAGFIIGTLGVLDDVTVTQAAVVWELAAADPTMSRRAMFGAALRVGRAHVASTVNTLVLAYAGTALPLLMLFAAKGTPTDHVLSAAPVAEEIVRALAGSIGIIAAVPLTTGLAVLTRRP